MRSEFKKIVEAALREDIGQGDITTRLLIPANAVAHAKIIVKDPAIVCGMELVRAVFQKLDPSLRIQFLVKDGRQVKKNTIIAKIKGRTRALLTGERVALNFLSYLSGIATQTNQFVKAVRPYKARILDTRKTIPLTRPLARLAVRCGGGTNHRYDLSEMVLVKDNHVAASLKKGTLHQLVRRLKESTKKLVEVEVDNLNQFQEVLRAQPDFILLDNMSIAQLKKAVALTKKYKGRRPQLEASGGIGLHNVKAVAASGVDRISVGKLTSSIPAIDVSMDFVTT